ncbi:leucine-rich repeat domain-containing protein [Flammeovirga sp. MY04]|uniref:leucine-rich repeat domain-containing protein n=1 Tax=Flammeovirga sp. MY04 TaxID=1191459 RepID=UPI0008061DD7|nr:leucine-rich repeat domain-containing protein [Flammeovirga sp. MY04]ANQ51150.1 leucine-rich repeat domain-containing protein [Flammeovirga sp. MY04]
MPSNQTPTEEIALSEAFKKKYTYFAVSIDSNGYVKSIAYNESNHPRYRSLGELITEVPDEFLQFKHVKRLYLDQNQLTSLPDFIQEFDSLEELDFHDNPLDELPEWVGKLKNLKRLDLSKTNIKTLPKSLTSLKHLEAIRFRHTPIKGFPEELYSFKSTLQELYIDELEELPEAISDFKKLKFIGGKIHSFKHLDKIPQLEKIYINDSKAKNFPANFGPFTTCLICIYMIVNTLLSYR